jgi:hypothetical protein
MRTKENRRGGESKSGVGGRVARAERTAMRKAHWQGSLWRRRRHRCCASSVLPVRRVALGCVVSRGLAVFVVRPAGAKGVAAVQMAPGPTWSARTAAQAQPPRLP